MRMGAALFFKGKGFQPTAGAVHGSKRPDFKPREHAKIGLSVVLGLLVRSPPTLDMADLSGNEKHAELLKVLG